MEKNTHTSHCFFMRTAMLLLMLYTTAVAQAVEYITDVMLIGAYQQADYDALVAKYTSNGWKATNWDLNHGISWGNGDAILLLYKTAESTDGFNHEYITDFYIQNRSAANTTETLNFMGRTYNLVPVTDDSDSHFKGQYGDLNSHTGASTQPIHLYYTKETFADNRVVTGITFNDTQSGGVGKEGNIKTGYDLNDGCSDLTSQEIYMHLSTATAPVKDCYISEVKLVGAGTSDELDTYLNQYAVDGWKAINYDLNKGINYGDGESIYLLYKTTISPDGLNHGYITDFYIQNRSTANTTNTLNYNNRLYQIVQYVGSNHFVSQKGDLNSGTGVSTDPIHLYFTTDRSYTDGRTVNGIYFNAIQSGAVGKEGGSTGYSLNAGTTGSNIYMHLTTASTHKGSQTQSYLDLFEPQVRGFRVKGWAFNPDEPDAPLPIRVEIRDANNQVYKQYVNITNNVLHTDLNEQYHLTGNHGFDKEFTIVDIPAGTYTIKVYASNLADGEKQVGGDKTLTITRTDPQGNLEVFESLPRGFRVQGWAYDPDAPSKSIPLRIEVKRANGTVLKSVDLTTDILREEVNTAKGITGNHGFSVTVPVHDNGNFIVKIYAYDVTYDSNVGLDNEQSLSIRDLYGSGTPSNPYTIDSDFDWELFATMVNEEANSFSNKTVALTADVNAFATVGTSDHSFLGTFNGGGNTLTVNINSTELGAAPFGYVDGATIKNLKVSGTVTGGNNHASGLIGFCNGTITISDCAVSANVVGTGYAGGLVGNGASSTLSIQNSCYDGTISGFNALAGGLVGWCEDATLDICGSVFAGAFTPSGSGKYHPIVCKQTTKAPTATVAKTYYLNTITATATSDNIISGADGISVSANFIDGSWDYPIEAANGKTYYAIPTGKRLPYSYGFGNWNLGAEGWSVVNAMSGTGIISHASNPCFRFKGNKFAQYLMSAELDDRSAILVSINYKMDYLYNKNNSFDLGYSTTTNDISSFIWVEEIAAVNLNYKLHERTFPKGTKYIAIRYVEPYASELLLDDFHFTACTAPAPPSISVTDMTEQSVTLTWAAPAANKTISGYAYQYKKASNGAWSAETQITATSATIENLLPNTCYNFRVKTIYPDEESMFLTTNFTTAMDLPYECGFENGLERWSTLNIHASTTSGIIDQYKHEGKYCFRFNDKGSGETDKYLISPPLGGKTGMKVSFYHRSVGTDEPKLQVGYSTTTTNPDNFTWVSNVTTAYNQWNKHEVTLPVGTKYMAIKFDYPEANHVVSALVDDFYFDVSSTFASPADLTLTEVTDHSATLSWTATASATGYAYQYRKIGDASWTTLTQQSGTSVTLSGLQANTDYDFRVKALYTDGNYSELTTLRIITDNVPMNLPYNEGFENGMGCWRLVGTHADNSKISPYAKFDGENGFMIYQSLYVDQILVSPCLNSSNEGVAISFNCKKSGAVNYPVAYYIGYSMTTRDPSAFKWDERHLCMDEGWVTIQTVSPKDTKYIAIRVESQSDIMYLDDFKFASYAPPAVPSQLSATDILATTATLTWDGHDANDFNVRIRKTLFYENFENGLDRWTFRYVGDGDEITYWRLSNPAKATKNILQAHSGTYAALAKSYAGINITNNVDNWLISPKVELDGILEFFVLQDPEHKEHYEVMVSTTTNDINAFTKIAEPGYGSNYWAWEEKKVDLRSYSGAEGYIAFRVYDRDKNFTAIDDISIYTSDWGSFYVKDEYAKISDLKPNTSYEFQVTGIKGVSSSNWSSSSIFTTTDVSDIILDDNVDNSATLIKHDMNLTNVTLSNRTLYKDGNWNTLCLPFDVTITSGPLSGDGVTAMTLNTATSGFANGMLTLNFDMISPSGEQGGLIPAGTPFIIKWNNTGDFILNPLFEGVTIKNISTEVNFSGGKFKGTYSPVAITANDQSVLFLGAKNTLYYPTGNMNINACRAYFQLNTPTPVKEFRLNFDGEAEETGLTPTLSQREVDGAIYDLQGRKVEKPFKGLYIVKGCKVLIK